MLAEWVHHLLSFSLEPEDAFFFNRFEFWVFFTGLLLVFSLLSNKFRIRNALLTLFSYYFFYKSGGPFVLLLLFSTLVDFILGKQIYKAKTRIAKKGLVFVSVFINLALLAYYKYSGFIIENINGWFGTKYVAKDYLLELINSFNGTAFNSTSILLPLGISFFTFQTISYSVDIYRGKIKPVDSVLDFAFYVSFFPQLVMGPIVRASEFVHQIYRPYRLSKAEKGKALYLIITGLIKKVVIADFIGAYLVNDVFSEPLQHTAAENIVATYGFAMQIYGDFSGYTNIAIGLALLLGFRLPENFRSPYKATSITDFWRRWHMSLSRWLRDYLYISLGGNRNGKIRMLLALMMTMLLGGLWHGASWSFVVWGGLHGVALIFDKLWWSIFPKKDNRFWLFNVISGLITFHFVLLTWMFFALPLHEVVHSILHIGHDFDSSQFAIVFKEHNIAILILGIAYLLHWIPTFVKNGLESAFCRLPDVIQAICLAVFALLLFQVMSADIEASFIYFRF